MFTLIGSGESGIDGGGTLGGDSGPENDSADNGSAGNGCTVRAGSNSIAMLRSAGRSVSLPLLGTNSRIASAATPCAMTDSAIGAA